MTNVRMCGFFMCIRKYANHRNDTPKEFAHPHIGKFAHQNLFFHIILSIGFSGWPLYLAFFF